MGQYKALPADGFVVIYVKDPEDLFEVFLGGSRR